MESTVSKEAASKKLTNAIERTYPTLGGDPEFFITTKEGKTLSACQFLPPKGDKTPVYANANQENLLGEYFFDGIQGEINIIPGTCREGLANRIWRVLSSVKTKIGNDYKLVMKPSVLVDRNVLDAADPEARRFGCTPDYNAYTGLQNESELDGDKHRVRYGGGHIHIAFKKTDRMYDSPDLFLAFIMLLDLMVGIPMLLLDVGPDSNRRREHYGKAGTFRETKYGVEYRQPSNVWLKSPELASLAWGLTRTAYRVMIAKVENVFWNKVKPEEVRAAIDGSNRDNCLEIYDKVRDIMASASHDDDPFCGEINRTHLIQDGGSGERYRKTHVNGTEVYEYVMNKTVDMVYGADCEKAWQIEPLKVGDTGSNGYVRVPSEIISGFIDGTLRRIEKTNKADFERLVTFGKEMSW